jgi:hypothetical protein
MVLDLVVDSIVLLNQLLEARVGKKSFVNVEELVEHREAT